MDQAVPDQKYHQGTMPEREYAEMVATLEHPVSIERYLTYVISCMQHTASVPPIARTPDEIIPSAQALAPRIVAAVAGVNRGEHLIPHTYNRGTMDQSKYDSIIEKLKRPMPRNQYAGIIELCNTHYADIPRRIRPRDEDDTKNQMVMMPIEVVVAMQGREIPPLNSGDMSEHEYVEIVKALNQPVSIAQYKRYIKKCELYNADVPPMRVQPNVVVSATGTRREKYDVTVANQSAMYNCGTMNRTKYREVVESLTRPMTLECYRMYAEVCIIHEADIPRHITLPPSAIRRDVTYDILPEEQTAIENIDNIDGGIASESIIDAGSVDSSIVDKVLAHRNIDSSSQCQTTANNTSPPRAIKYVGHADVDKFVNECTWPKNMINSKVFYARFKEVTSSDKTDGLVIAELRKRGYIVKIHETKEKKAVMINGKSKYPIIKTYELNSKYIST